MELKPGFQKTDVGVIPDNWTLVRLGDLVDSNRLIRYGVVQPGQFDASGCIMLRSQDYSKGWCSSDSTFRVSRSLANQYRNARLQSGDLIVTVVGAGTGQVEVAPEWLDGAVLSRSTARVAINEQKADRTFCRYILQSPFGQSQIRNQIKEGAQPVVSCPDMARFWIPLPPTPAEQRAIAGALSDVDALIGALDQLLAKKRDLKQAAMQQLLTGHQRLPGFASEWDTKQLRQIVSLIPSGIYGEENPREGLVRSLVATTAHIDEDDMWNSKKMPTRYFLADKIVKYAPANGDLIVVKSSGSAEKIQSGKIGFIDADNAGQFLFSNFLMLVRPVAVVPKFLYCYLTSYNVKKYLPMLVEASTYPNIRIDEYLSLEIPIPSAAEQTAIAEVLSDMDAELAALEQKRDKTRLLKQGMMQELLTGRTRLI